MITNMQIRSIFMECDNKNPEGLYANDLDVFEFGRAIEKVVRQEERRACIAMVKTLNHEVARALEDYRRLSDKVE